jgi:cytochrome c
MNNDPLFLTKFIGAILTAGLLAMASGFISEQIFHHETPHSLAFPIGGNAGTASTSAQAKATPVGPIANLLASADVERGQKLFKACAACHTPTNGGANKVGPNLWNVVGRTMAGTDGYKYSSALRKMEGAWDYETLNRFLFMPKELVPGTKMTYAGIKAANKRADIIVYIRSLSPNPLPLP